MCSVDDGTHARNTLYRRSGLLPLSPASWCYPADPSQTGAGRWGGLCHRSSREATENSHLDAVAGQRPHLGKQALLSLASLITSQLVHTNLRQARVSGFEGLDLMIPKECGAV